MHEIGLIEQSVWTNTAKILTHFTYEREETISYAAGYTKFFTFVGKENDFSHVVARFMVVHLA